MRVRVSGVARVRPERERNVLSVSQLVSRYLPLPLPRLKTVMRVKMMELLMKKRSCCLIAAVAAANWLLLLPPPPPPLEPMLLEPTAAATALAALL